MGTKAYPPTAHFRELTLEEKAERLDIATDLLNLCQFWRGGPSAEQLGGRLPDGNGSPTPDLSGKGQDLAEAVGQNTPDPRSDGRRVG